MTETLLAADWMAAPATRAVITALEVRGGADCARFVGGAVRNSLMGLAVDDIDIATTLTPDQVTQALEAAGLRAIPTGIEHGTVTAIADRRPFVITTLRRDVATDGRHAEVAFTDDWAADAQRRDFTFNALYADPSGQVFDPTGEGVADAVAGRVVFVGDPAVRLQEDYLRVLRFFRFYAWYGRGEPDTAAVAACAAAHDRLGALSAERVQKELFKLLAAPDPRLTLNLMQQTGVLAAVLPLAVPLDRTERLIEIDLQQGFPADPELRLASLWPADPLAVKRAAASLRLSNAARDRLAGAAATEPGLSPGMSAKAARQALWRTGVPAFADRLRLAWADAGDAPGPWLTLLDQAKAWARPELPVRGEDVLAAGVPAGSAVGQVLAAVETWWIEHDFPRDRDLALAQLRAIAAAR
jgi:poly(A) polymerase